MVRLWTVYYVFVAERKVVNVIILVILGIIFLTMIIFFVQWLIFTSQRLDKLHRRYEFSWLALENTLNMRAEISAEVGRILDDQVLLSLARQVNLCPRSERYRAENELSQQLLMHDLEFLPIPMIADLADKHARITIARRFYDDAVHDTKNLRQTRLVRWFHLSGFAPEPEYFNITEFPENIFQTEHDMSSLDSAFPHELEA